VAGEMNFMAKISRREAREILVGLLFETEFHADEDVNSIYALAIEDREIPNVDYVRNSYFAICDNAKKIDAIISEHSRGWKTERMSKLSRSILRLCVYEMLYVDDIPYTVSINEAVELAKKFDDDKARPFINGILNSVKNQLEAK
jgi:N utilization substance protein B